MSAGSGSESATKIQKEYELNSKWLAEKYIEKEKEKLGFQHKARKYINTDSKQNS